MSPRVRPDGPSPREDAPSRGGGVLLKLCIALIVVAALFIVCWVDLRQSSSVVAEQVEGIVSSVNKLEDVVRSGDAAALGDLAADISEKAHELHGDVRTPSWFLASIIPIVGSDARCAQRLSTVFVKLSDEVLLPLSSSSDLTSYAEVLGDASVDLAALRRVSRSLSAVAPTLSSCADEVSALPDAHDERLRLALASAREGITSANNMVGMVNSLLPSLPAMLGEGGQERTYLVVTLTNADLRSCGGLPAAWTLVTVADGNISVGKTVALQQMPDDFLSFETDELSAVPSVDDGMGYLTTLPEFPRAAQLMAQGYEEYEGVHVDGIIAVDPVFLQRLLSLTGGSVTTSDGTVIDGTNASWALMSDACWRYGNDGWNQDHFFAEASSLIAETTVHDYAKVNPFDLYVLSEQAAQERRISFWVEDEALEQVLTSFGFAGTLLTGEEQPVLGIYLNDETWGRISWYAQASTVVSDPQENADGSMTYHVETTVTNTGTKEVLDYAPRFVWGFNEEEKRTNSDMVLVPLITAPAGGSITNVKGDGVGELSERTIYGLSAISGVIHLDVGESFVLTYEVTTSPAASSPLVVQMTPLAQENALTITNDAG